MHTRASCAVYSVKRSDPALPSASRPSQTLGAELLAPKDQKKLEKTLKKFEAVESMVCGVPVAVRDGIFDRCS